MGYNRCKMERVRKEHQQVLLQIREEAQPILAALEAYRRDHEHYPTDLEALYPDYLPRISLPERPDYGLAAEAWGYCCPGRKEAPYELALVVPPNFCLCGDLVSRGRFLGLLAYRPLSAPGVQRNVGTH